MTVWKTIQDAPAEPARDRLEQQMQVLETVGGALFLILSVLGALAVGAQVYHALIK